MGGLRLVALLILAVWLGCGSALAERRVALVIANSAYKSAPRPTNPVNDALRLAKSPIERPRMLCANFGRLDQR
jgi:hypothetical protein